MLVLLCMTLPAPLLHARNEKTDASQQILFASPDDAVKSLLEAARNKDRPAMHKLFGPDARDMVTGDEVQDANNFESFAKAVQDKCTPEPEGDNKVILNIGAERWPFPIPLVKKDGHWLFDTDAGREEIINRHIGRDELNAIGVCRAYVQAQTDYFNAAAEGGVKKYAEKFKSTVGKKDGLYWESDANKGSSPLGALVAEARAEGYGHSNSDGSPQPFHGYYFKILRKQGAAAPGGSRSYMHHRAMTDGFALVAYPVNWDHSGIMTFMVNQDGKVYQCNLGEKTGKIARDVTKFNPDNSWTLVKEDGRIEDLTEMRKRTNP